MSCTFIPIEVPIDQTKITSIRNAIYRANIRSPPLQQRPIQHFTPNTYKLLDKLRKKTPKFLDSNITDSMNRN